MSVTLSLALNMRRMLSTNNLVRKMHACETMGAITVICTDKTGTLTQNLMQVYEPSSNGLKMAEKSVKMISANWWWKVLVPILQLSGRDSRR